MGLFSKKPKNEAEKPAGKGDKKALSESDFVYDMSAKADGVVIKGIKKKVSHIVIPELIEGYPVVEIESIGFAKDRFLPDNYETFSCLKTITMPDTIEILGKEVFSQGRYWDDALGREEYMSAKITSIKLPGNLRIIGPRCFNGCQDLKSVVWNDKLTHICTNAFSGTGLTEVVLPESLIAIYLCVFLGCSNLTTVKMPAKDICYTTVDTDDFGFNYRSFYALSNANDSFRFCDKLTMASKKAIRDTGYTDDF